MGQKRIQTPPTWNLATRDDGGVGLRGLCGTCGEGILPRAGFGFSLWLVVLYGCGTARLSSSFGSTSTYLAPAQPTTKPLFRSTKASFLDSGGTGVNIG